MNLTEIGKLVHTLAREKGWYEKPKTPLEAQMLIVSEIGEAAEEVRKGTLPIYAHSTCLDVPVTTTNYEDIREQNLKPEGEVIELADAIIRILDYAEYRGFDIARAVELKHNYNKSRSYKHGGKIL